MAGRKVGPQWWGLMGGLNQNFPQCNTYFHVAAERIGDLISMRNLRNRLSGDQRHIPMGAGFSALTGTADFPDLAQFQPHIHICSH